MIRQETAIAGPNRRLLEWLAGHGVEHEVREHPLTVTARETARAEGIDPRRFAKTLAVETDDGRRALVVLDATDHLDFHKAARALQADRVRLLTEAELTDLAPDCDTGTLPPVGALCGLPVFADREIREDDEISFHAGSHRHTVHVDRAGWEIAASVSYADLAATDITVPAWSRS